MPIISVEIMKTIDQSELKKKKRKKTTNKDKKEQGKQKLTAKG